VAVIIPAKDEAARIGAVLDVVTRCKLATDIIVVCDGCEDDTAAVARSYKGVRVVELPYNRGKGAAMVAGVRETDAPVLAFVDADLTGLKPEHLDKIILPILTGTCEMCVGVFRGGKFWSDTAQRISPYISGQRALRRSLFDSIPYLDELRMGVEVTLNTFAKRQKARVTRVVLHGVSNTFKEKKLGVLKGTAARTRMYAEIARAIARNRRRQPKRIKGSRLRTKK
jgi:glycosyltransferase involved in cell wall biosynthesis